MSQATYVKITREIAALQAQADAIKRKEVDVVIARIMEAIAAYDLAAQDLGLNRSSSQATKVGRGGAVRYSDGRGNTWSGNGRRPKWFLDAVAAGKSPEELKVAGTALGSKAKARRQPAPRRDAGVLRKLATRTARNRGRAAAVVRNGSSTRSLAAKRPTNFAPDLLERCSCWRRANRVPLN